MQTSTLIAALVAAPLLTGIGFAFGPGLSSASSLPSAAERAAAADTYGVDLAHSHILFRTTHLGLSYAHGRFNMFNGEFKLGDSPSIRIEIDTSSIDTQNEKRDGHLASPDFFDAEQFPETVFQSTKIEDQGDGKFKVTGDLELRGKKKQLSFDATKIGEGPDPWEGHRAGLHASFKIKRSDFGMDWGLDNGSVGDEVLVEVSLEGIRK